MKILVFYSALGGFVVGMAYGSWAASMDGPMPIWLTVLIGGLGLAWIYSVLAVTNLAE